MKEYKKILNLATTSDEVIDYLEDNGYLEEGAWDSYRGKVFGAKEGRFLNKATAVWHKMRSNYISDVFPRLNAKIGDIMVSQYDYTSFVKSGVISLSPNVLEQSVYKFADDLAGAHSELID